MRKIIGLCVCTCCLALDYDALGQAWRTNGKATEGAGDMSLSLDGVLNL